MSLYQDETCVNCKQSISTKNYELFRPIYENCNLRALCIIEPIVAFLKEFQECDNG